MANTKYEPQQFGSLKYPLGLSTGQLYPDAICFTVMKRTGVSLEEVGGAVAETAGYAKQKFSEATGIGTEWMNDEDRKKIKQIEAKNISQEKMNQEVNAYKDAAWKTKNKDSSVPDNMWELAKGTVRQLVGSTKTLHGDVAKRGTARKRALTSKKQNKHILGSIYMNMPAGITFTDKANWAGDSLGTVGNLVKNAIGGGGDAGATARGALLGSAGNIAGAGVGGVAALAARMGLKGGMVAGVVGAAASGSVLQKGAEAALGMSMNPYMEMMFSGIGFRDFQFDFTMRPRSEPEMESVHQIITQFRTHSRPSWHEGSLGKSFMDYPMEFNVQFLTASGEGEVESYSTNSFVPQLKTCVCDSVTTNYSPQNMWTAHKNGKPVAITLGLHFQETELVMAPDVRDDKF